MYKFSLFPDMLPFRSRRLVDYLNTIGVQAHKQAFSGKTNYWERCDIELGHENSILWEKETEKMQASVSSQEIAWHCQWAKGKKKVKLEHNP